MRPSTPRGERLDKLLVERGLAPTRERAQALVLAGAVRVAGRRAEKAGERFPEGVALEVQPGAVPYASRGGMKLAAALDAFSLDPDGQFVLDVGASTGGFTDCLLQRGARRVVALDVGKGQLDWRLRQDPRVVPLEGVNARALTPELLRGRLAGAGVPEPLPTWATVDVSFISLTLVLPPVARCLEGEGLMLALVKPQFEVGKGKVGKGGVVRDPALHRGVLERLWDFAEGRGWTVRGACPSPLRGPRGNREFFLYLEARPSGPAAEREKALAAALAEHPFRRGGSLPP